MSLSILNEGHDNVIDIHEPVVRRSNGSLTIKGNGNVVVFGPDVTILSCTISIGSNCRVSVGNACFAHELFLHAADDVSCEIGEGVGFNARVRLLAHEPAKIHIGSGCLFASDIDVTVSDMHSIFDVETGCRINPARDVTIHDRVWIGQRSLILKGAVIGEGSIIGAASIVTGDIDAYSLAAGAPARVIRKGVTWDSRLLPRMPG